MKAVENSFRTRFKKLKDRSGQSMVEYVLVLLLVVLVATKVKKIVNEQVVEKAGDAANAGISSFVDDINK